METGKYFGLIVLALILTASFASAQTDFGGDIIGQPKDFDPSAFDSLKSGAQASAPEAYIVMFNDMSVVEKYNQLKDENQRLINKKNSMFFLNPVRLYYSWFLIKSESRILAEVEEYESGLEELFKAHVDDLVMTLKADRSVIVSESTTTSSRVTLRISGEQAKMIESKPYVRSVTPDFQVELFMSDSVPLLGVDDAWDLVDSDNNNLHGDGVRIAVIDSGFDLSHPAFMGTSVIYKRCSCTSAACCQSDDDLTDSEGHGTHVLGSLASRDTTYSGVAKGADYMLVKTGMSWTDLANSIDYVTGFRGGSGTDGVRADIVSMSIGLDQVRYFNVSCSTYDHACSEEDIKEYYEANKDEELANDPLVVAIKSASGLGIQFVIAAGNEGGIGEGHMNVLSHVDDALIVGATGKDDVITPYSSFGYSDSEDSDVPDVVSTGGCTFDCLPNRQLTIDDLKANALEGIISTKSSYDTCGVGPVLVGGVPTCLDAVGGSPVYAFEPYDNDGSPDHYFVSFQGTSMATPQVAGMVALIKQMNPGWTNAQIKQAIRETAIDLGQPATKQGAGRINVTGAIGFFTDATCTPPTGVECGVCGLTCTDSYACADGVCESCGDTKCNGDETPQTCGTDCTCTPACEDKVCGSDGCGGTCGTCPGDQLCTETGTCRDILPSDSNMVGINARCADGSCDPYGIPQIPVACVGAEMDVVDFAKVYYEGLPGSTGSWLKDGTVPASGSFTFKSFSVDDTEDPRVRLIAPTHESAKPVGMVDFIYSVYDNDDANPMCRLWIDEEVVVDYQIVSQGRRAFSYDLAAGSYSWNVECKDDNQNAANSTNGPFTLIVSADISDNMAPEVILVSPERDAIKPAGAVDFIYEVYDDYDPRCKLIVDNAVVRDFAPVAEGRNYFDDVELSTGRHTWDVTCTDNSGNEASSTTGPFALTVTDEVDSEAPEVVLVAPENGDTKPAGPIDFIYEVHDNYDPECMLMFQDGFVMRPYEPVAEGRNAFEDVELGPGNYQWDVFCMDNAGNKAGSTNGPYLLVVEDIEDTEAPEVILVAPEDDDTKPQGFVDFIYEVYDNYDPKCRLLVDGEVVRDYRAVAEGRNSFDSYYMSEGTYTWDVQCMDNSGNEAQSQNGPYDLVIDASIVDDEAPAVILVAPEDDTTKPQGFVDFVYEVYDNYDPRCRLLLGDEVVRDYMVVAEGRNVFAHVSMVAGDYSWDVQCIDNSGNAALSLNGPYTLHIDAAVTDDVPPEVRLLAPGDGTVKPDQPIDFVYEVYDNYDPACTLFIDDRARRSGVVANGVNSFDNIILAVGTHAWKVVCRDNSGNIGESQTFSLEVMDEDDKQAPVVTLIAPEDGSSKPVGFVDYFFRVSDNYDPKCRLLIGGEEARPLKTVAEGVAYFDNVLMAAGTYEWDVECVDNTGNAATSANGPFTLIIDPAIVDDEAPVTELTWPLDNARVASGDVALQYTVDDNYDPRCRLYLNGGIRRHYVPVAEGENQFVVRLSAGSYSWDVECRDNSGNAGMSANGPFHLTVADEVGDCTYGTRLCANGNCCSDCSQCGGEVDCGDDAQCSIGNSCACPECEGQQDACVAGEICYYEDTEPLAAYCDCNEVSDDVCPTDVSCGYLDPDCGGCAAGTMLCNDDICRADCGAIGPKSCIGSPDGQCLMGEGCACADCPGERDSCAEGLVCDADTDLCSLGAGKLYIAHGAEDAGLLSVYDGTEFTQLGEFDDEIYVMEEYKDELYLGLLNGKLMRYNGARFQEVEIPAYIIAGLPISTLDVLDDKLFIGDASGRIFSYDGSELEMVHDVGETPTVIYASVVLDGNLYYGHGSGDVTMYDGTEYDVLGNMGTHVLALGSYDGKVYAGLYNGTIVSYDGTGFENVYTYDADGEYDAAIIEIVEHDGKLYFNHFDGNMTVLDGDDFAFIQGDVEVAAEPQDAEEGVGIAAAESYSTDLYRAYSGGMIYAFDGATSSEVGDREGEVLDMEVFPKTLPEACFDGLDNDRDGDVDCDDTDCADECEGPELCGDNTRLCANGDCCADCADCGGEVDCKSAASCEEGDSCACPECDGKRDHCEVGLVCDIRTKHCEDAGGRRPGDGSGGSSSRCDADGDGFKQISNSCGGTDCNDKMYSVYPGAKESCNKVDDNCDGKIDEGCDDDNDDYCDSSMKYDFISGSSTCSAPGDCDDTDKDINPNAEEACDGTDNNCNGRKDEDCDGTGAGQAQVSIGAEVSADPKIFEIFTLKVDIKNTGSALTNLQVKFDVPQGWETKGPVKVDRLDAGTSRTVSTEMLILNYPKDEASINVQVLAAGKVVAEKVVDVDVSIPEFMVVAEPKFDDNYQQSGGLYQVDFYYVVNNLDKPALENLDLEFDLNVRTSTAVADYVSGFDVPADSIYIKKLPGPYPVKKGVQYTVQGHLYQAQGLFSPIKAIRTSSKEFAIR